MKNNSIFYLIGIFVLLAIGIWFLVVNSSGQNIDGGSFIATSNSGVQEVVIGMKNFNYYPNTITVESGKPVRITLDSSVQGCLRDFTIKSFGVRKYLPTPSDYVEFTPDKPGTYSFACSMGMGTGILVVK